jgi:carbon-monoxide dehydrogenase medium subunit
LVNLKEGAVDYRRLVSLQKINELAHIELLEGKGLVIGAMATVNQVARNEIVQNQFPGLRDAAMSLAADQVRNLATVAGNLCSAVPSADMAPILLAHRANLRVVSKAGERIIPLAGFFKGPRLTVLEPAEVVVAIELQQQAPGMGSASIRQGGRASLSLPIASAAAVVAMERGICRQATVALGSVAPTPIVATIVGDFLVGKRFSAEVLAEAGELASAATEPIDDLRSSKEYRLELVKVLARRALVRATERAERG